MRVFAPRESGPGETRAAATPDSVHRLAQLGPQVEIAVEAGIGARFGEPDDAYRAAGAAVITDRSAALAGADLVARLRPPEEGDVARLKPGAIHVSYLDPFNRRALVEALADRGVAAICMELIPRTTIAQKMDALSSQASLAGYVAVILAAERLPKVLPMMTTPAGTLQPSRVFVIGAGVAGLQAIATARRLGARVEAFDTRPEVAEQVQSLGARFVRIDLGETGSTAQGYAKALTPEQLEKQRQGMAKVCAQSDVVITTAQVFGRRAPRILTRDMVAGMRPGSVVVDLAVESGGNVEGSEPDREIDLGGVRIVGVSNLPGRVAAHASQMYASNVAHLVAHLWDKAAGTFRLDPADEILEGCLVTHEGRIRHEMLLRHYAEQGA